MNLFTQNILPLVRLELTAFRLWDWRAAYCATEADASCKFLLEINCIDLFIYYSVIVIISVLSFIFSNHFFLNTLWYRYVAYMERYAAKCNENNHSTSITMLEVDCYNSFKKSSLSKIKIASAGNRTRVNCLEGSYAHHYTTDACWNGEGCQREQKWVRWRLGGKQRERERMKR